MSGVRLSLHLKHCTTLRTRFRRPLNLRVPVNLHGQSMASRFNIYSDLVISRNELDISPIHFLISLIHLVVSAIQLMISTIELLISSIQLLISPIHLVISTTL